MSLRVALFSAVLCSLLFVNISCGGGSTAPAPAPSTSTAQLSVQPAGNGSGTVDEPPSGIECQPTCGASYKVGTKVLLTASPSANSMFAGWGGACTGVDACSITVKANTSVVATFSLLPPMNVSLNVTEGGTGQGTVLSNPSGINCGTMCSAAFKVGTQVTLTETPATNSYFTGWSGGGCSGTGSTCTLTLNANNTVQASFSPLPLLSVTLTGTGQGTVTSNPSGINCGQMCSAAFNVGTQVVLTETPGTNSVFAGWSGGGCGGTGSTCTVTMNSNTQVSAAFSGSNNISVLKHIVFLAQENRSLDHYFGAMRQYWAQNGYPDQSFDGLPQFNPMSGIPPLYGPPPAIPGCDPNSPPPDDCVFDPQNPVTSYHLITQCIENPSPSWNEGHVDWDYNDPTGLSNATLNGFVWTAGHDARAMQPPFFDTNGIRAMGYYDGNDLNYYYFMASNFATSDRFFNAAMTRTHPNREYLVAGTSQGYAYPVGTDQQDKALLTAPTIFQELQNAGISWKIYVDPTGSTCTGPPYDPSCLLGLSYIQFFQWGQTIPAMYPHNIGTIGPPGTCGSSPCDYENDLANGTLPQVAQIEPATDGGFDEHPSVSDSEPNDIQRGANYVSSLIDGLMNSSSWPSSAFILAFDENGGLYDHVSPQSTVSPDGIKPVDLLPGDICTQTSGPTCDFVYTGYRIPLIVISPYSKKNYVSHTVADLTAILKFIETRFNLPPLTKRDAAQMDMTEFFDFNDPVWLTPPSPPAQNTSGACYLNQLP